VCPLWLRVQLKTQKGKNMSIKTQMQKAIAEHDSKQAGKLVEFLRFKFGYTYDDCQKAFEKHCNLSASEFETLMREADIED
jgi:hypothetical protein